VVSLIARRRHIHRYHIHRYTTFTVIIVTGEFPKLVNICDQNETCNMEYVVISEIWLFGTKIPDENLVNLSLKVPSVRFSMARIFTTQSLSG
jgi:hypothetical protein